MSATNQQNVPLFVAARDPSGSVSHLLMSNASPGDGAGPYYCRVSAPNGMRVEGEVPQLDYATVRKLFRTPNDIALALDSAASKAGGRKLRNADLQIWSGGRRVNVESDQLELIPGARGTSCVRIAQPEGTPIDHIQMWSEPGAVTVTVWPAGGSLFPLPGLPDVQRRVRPVVLGNDMLCSAYWGFYRHSNLGAVQALGAIMVERAVEGRPVEEGELIVAAHYALNFLDPAREVLAPLVRLLEKRSSSDAAILLWSTVFDFHLDYSPKLRQRAFERALHTIMGNGCLYTEIFRLLVQRLGEGEAVWRESEPVVDSPPEAIEAAIAWVRKLTEATYWDAEHLTYRALDPANPEANATDDQLDIGAKKKSAIVPLS